MPQAHVGCQGVKPHYAASIKSAQFNNGDRAGNIDLADSTRSGAA
jgi:hypothetical protein